MVEPLADLGGFKAREYDDRRSMRIRGDVDKVGTRCANTRIESRVVVALYHVCKG